MRGIAWLSALIAAADVSSREAGGAIDRACAIRLDDHAMRRDDGTMAAITGIAMGLEDGAACFLRFAPCPRQDAAHSNPSSRASLWSSAVGVLKPLHSHTAA